MKKIVACTLRPTPFPEVGEPYAITSGPHDLIVPPTIVLSVNLKSMLTDDENVAIDVESA